MLSYVDVARLVEKTLAKPGLIAIDGYPLLGKSTLAVKLAEDFNLNCLPFDDFLLPVAAWPANIQANFPFPFFRHQDFANAVRALAQEKICRYYPFDWDKMNISNDPRILQNDKPVIVEGASVLNPDVAAFYDLTFFVESDQSNVMDAVIRRDGAVLEKEWRTLFLPSVDLYLKTNPQGRADHLVAGRGISGDRHDSR